MGTKLIRALMPRPIRSRPHCLSLKTETLPCRAQGWQLNKTQNLRRHPSTYKVTTAVLVNIVTPSMQNTNTLISPKLP